MMRFYLEERAAFGLEIARKERKNVELAGVPITHKQGGAELAGTCNCRLETEKVEPRSDQMARIGTSYIEMDP